MHYASVTYKDAVSIPPEGVISLKLVAHKARGGLVTGPAPIPLSNYTLSPCELERLLDYNRNESQSQTVRTR